MAVLALAGCRSASRSDGQQDANLVLSPGTHVMPARLTGDRFFGTPRMTNGDTLVLFLDTGGGTLMWEPTVARYRMPIVDSVRAAAGGYIRLVDLPAFKPERSVPPVIAPNRIGARLSVRSTAQGFAGMIVRSSLGQLGATWFGDRVWTLDYPHRRLVLHDVAPPPGPAAHRVNLGFTTDTAGRRVNTQGPAIGIAIDGDSLNMIFDTGATIWLTPEALARIGDKQAAERGTSLIWPPIFEKWRARHPEWRVIENADVLTKQAMIEVPVVSIGGFDVGPVWFMQYVSGGNPQPPAYPPNTPTIKKQISGTIGGSTLRFFSVMLDYPRAVAEFSRPASR